MIISYLNIKGYVDAVMYSFRLANNGRKLGTSKKNWRCSSVAKSWL
ncbi:hypothetical protein BN3087_400031 [Sulfurovum sp. enrichment culture clone C5]|uniref:Uncharacterized protein n=1 Tax=Sulfurovum sp. enrichment culture clone C5 TaxID=497650 RepID=A0A0S4XMX2_9BACT|nr:hypothetical protein BN3087_400031 [Sulfurovum sp. enrichment culture clone C5]